jgi:hypothetical protein
VAVSSLTNSAPRSKRWPAQPASSRTQRPGFTCRPVAALAGFRGVSTTSRPLSQMLRGSHCATSTAATTSMSQGVGSSSAGQLHVVERVVPGLLPDAGGVRRRGQVRRLGADPLGVAFGPQDKRAGPAGVHCPMGAAGESRIHANAKARAFGLPPLGASLLPGSCLCTVSGLASRRPFEVARREAGRRRTSFPPERSGARVRLRA